MEDVDLVGRNITWYQSNGQAMSRIERALVSDERGSIGEIYCFGLFLGLFLIIVPWC